MLHWYSEAPGLRTARWMYGHARLWDGLVVDAEDLRAALSSDAAVRWWLEHGEVDADDTLERLRRGLAQLVLVPESRFGGGCGPQVVWARPEEDAVPLRLLETPQPASEALTWLEIVLVDASDRPVPHEPYAVELPDGRTITGQLDAEGFARIDGVRAGQCVVRFPACDRGDVEAA